MIYQSLSNLSMKLIREAIRDCEDRGHKQQVAFSTHHDGLTQVCFSCRYVRTTLEV